MYQKVNTYGTNQSTLHELYVLERNGIVYGKRGVVGKRCLKCRDKDDKQKRKPEVKDRRNEMQRQKKYYEVCREKQRNKNEAAYLQHNAQVMKQWRDANKEHVSAWRTKNLTYRLRGMQQQAKRKGIAWDEQLTREMCEAMMKSPCVYCGYLSEQTLNGIDRMDSTWAYTPQNCVSSCKACNFMKKCLDPMTFIERCHHIAYCRDTSRGKPFPGAWSDACAVSYQTYKHRASEKSLTFDLTTFDFMEIKSGPCNYCGKQNTGSHQNGVDRRNNGLGYIAGNCVSCCRECNQMKTAMSDSEFILHATAVSVYQSAHRLVVPDKVHTCKTVIAKLHRLRV